MIRNFGGLANRIPPLFEIGSRKWYWKIIEQGQHNWALIDCCENFTATVYFFHDCGKTLGRNPYTIINDEYSAVVDSIDFSSYYSAYSALSNNRFFRFDSRSSFECYMPKEKFWDARKYEEGIYSSGRYWAI